MLFRLALAACLAALLHASPALAAPVPEGYSFEHAWFETTDGVQLHAGVFLPEKFKGQGVPTIVTITPYTAPNGGVTGAAGGEGAPNSEGPVIRFPELFSDAKIGERGYAYVQVDVRGFGGSGGCFEYYGPKETEDAKVAIEWIAAQKWSNGKVATWGKSYDAAEQVLALAARPPHLTAGVIQAPGLSAYTALWQNRTHYATGRYATSGTYTADDLAPPQNPETLTDPNYLMAALAPVTSTPGQPTCRADSQQMNTIRDRDDAFWKGREPYKGAVGSTVPTFWLHGFSDANTKPEHVEVWSGLKGVTRGWFGQWTHVRGHEAAVGRPGFLEESMRFLDRYVRGISVPEADPPVSVQEGNGEGRWRAETEWPPSDARAWSLPLRKGSYADKQGNSAEGTSAGTGHWTVTQPLADRAHSAGEIVLRAKVSAAVPEVNVIALVYDIAPDGTASFVARGAATLKEAGAQDVVYKLLPQDWAFAAGNRIGVLLTGSDDSWYTPGITGSTVEVTGGAVEFPMLRFVRDAAIEGGISDGISDARPFKVAETVIGEAVTVAAPPAQVARPVVAARPVAGSPPGVGAPPGVRALTLRLKVSGRGAKRWLIASGRTMASGKVRLTLRFGGVTVSRRSGRVKRGAYRVSFPVGRLKAGRVEVLASVPGAPKVRAAVRLRRR